nr:ADP-glucose pyrophosphorylase small subunit 2 [Ipomoea batatas]GMC67037.1 ADP-glucose pyrophosphorylase small subunit 2 [Ipomoea batatas]GME00762.1 ADP-glucose pyrophosphorylase small subunit 2 [Ipomoea batatas]
MSAAIGAPKLAPYTCAAKRNDASALRAARFKSLSFASSNFSGDKLVSLVSRRCSRSGGKLSERQERGIYGVENGLNLLFLGRDEAFPGDGGHRGDGSQIARVCLDVVLRERDGGDTALGPSVALLIPVPAAATVRHHFVVS